MFYMLFGALENDCFGRWLPCSDYRKQDSFYMYISPWDNHYRVHRLANTAGANQWRQAHGLQALSNTGAHAVISAGEWNKACGRFRWTTSTFSLQSPWYMWYFFLKMQSEGTLRFLWMIMKTLKPSIPSLSSIKQFRLPIDLQPQKVQLRLIWVTVNSRSP